MKLLVLTKRHHMGMDAYQNRHGRYFAIPELLAQSTNITVTGLVADYHPSTSGNNQHPETFATWDIVACAQKGVPRIDRFWQRLRRTIEITNPDIIWAGGDALIAIMAERAQRQYDIPTIIDLKDNYEAYRITKFPGVKHALRRALGNATAVTCGSHALQKYATTTGATTSYVLPMAADHNNFFPIDQARARTNLDLPLDAFYVGTAGKLSARRDTQTLSDAVDALHGKIPNLALLVAGARDSSWNRPRKTPTYDLGQVPLGEVNWLFNALDIAVITNRTNTFGEHCYPQKLHEMLACKTPVIAARTSAFSRHPLPDGVIATYSPQSPSELAQAIWAAAIHKERTNTIEFKADTWHERANQLQFILENEHQHHL